MGQGLVKPRFVPVPSTYITDGARLFRVLEPVAGEGWALEDVATLVIEILPLPEFEKQPWRKVQDAVKL